MTVFLVACDHTMPTPPTPVVGNPAPVTPPQPTNIRITGAVRDDNDRPVDGAALAFQVRGTPTAMTDAAGKYDVSLDPTGAGGGFEVEVQRAGFESSWYWATVSASEVTRNFRLHQPQSMNAGDSARLSIIPDDPACGFDLEYRCRRVLVRSSAAGTLKLEAVPDKSTVALGVVIRDVQYPGSFVSQLSTRVEAGSETPVLVLLVWTWTDSESFVLNTRLDRD